MRDLIPFIIVSVLLTCSCTRQAPPARQQTTIWRPLGSWSGRDNLQTESFPSDGFFRINWETKHETKPSAGRFKLTVGSSISGRPLQVAIDFQGAGHNIAYVTEDPRTFYVLVESSNVDWTFSIDEGIPATMEDKPEK